jgi:hypothetical protein
MSVTTQAGISIGAVFGAVAASANAVTSLFSTATDSVGMLDRYVKDASLRQRQTSAADSVTFTEELAVRKAKEVSNLQLDVIAFCANSDQHRDLYNDAYSKVMAAIAKA